MACEPVLPNDLHRMACLRSEIQLCTERQRVDAWRCNILVPPVRIWFGLLIQTKTSGKTSKPSRWVSMQPPTTFLGQVLVMAKGFGWKLSGFAPPDSSAWSEMGVPGSDWAVYSEYLSKFSHVIGVPHSLCWGGPNHCLLLSMFTLKWRTKANVRRPPPGWLVRLVIDLEELAKSWCQNPTRTTYKTYSCIFSGICGPGVYWAPGMSSPILRMYKLDNQLPVSSGLRDHQVILLHCRLDYLVKGLG